MSYGNVEVLFFFLVEEKKSFTLEIALSFAVLWFIQQKKQSFGKPATQKRTRWIWGFVSWDVGMPSFGSRIGLMVRKALGLPPGPRDAGSSPPG